MPEQIGVAALQQLHQGGEAIGPAQQGAMAGLQLLVMADATDRC